MEGNQLSFLDSLTWEFHIYIPLLLISQWPLSYDHTHLKNLRKLFQNVVSCAKLRFRDFITNVKKEQLFLGGLSAGSDRHGV